MMATAVGGRAASEGSGGRLLRVMVLGKKS